MPWRNHPQMQGHSELGRGAGEGKVVRALEAGGGYHEAMRGEWQTWDFILDG